MSRPESFDALVLGSGQAGKPLAVALAKAGRRTALVEREHVGGSCINYGCTPTKTMVASARVAYLARRAGDYGVRVGSVSVDLARVRERKRSMVARFRAGVLAGIERTEGLELVRGHARLAGGHTVEVALDGGGTRTLEAPWIFLNTGTRTAVPPIDGLGEVPWLDNASVMELAELPPHLLVLGGGYIGLEFGQMFRRFGSEVTIVQRDRQLLAREDPDVAEAVREILEEDGIRVLLGSEARRVRRDGGGLRLEVETGSGGSREVSGSHLLVAAGRTPNTDDLGLEAAGVETVKGGHVKVNERLETSAPGVWALGDVKGGPAFTHVSYDDFRIVRDNLLGEGGASTAGRLVPYTVFIDPQLGRVGLTEGEARVRAGEEGWDVAVARLPMRHVARALEMDETRGFMKAVVDRRSERILGCAILGVEGGEVMSVLETAMMGGLPYPAIRDATFAHPTLAESLNNLFSALDGEEPT
jgi:pyruvate/2-oxoglutarate dehydrogenase complex dihydrolipoamide dehydrogenase (E3) component